MSLYKAIAEKTATAATVEGVAMQYRPQTDEYILKVPHGMNEDQYAAKLLGSGSWQYVEPDWKVYAVGDPNDPLYPQQWHLPKIQASLAWDLFTGNSSVIIALTDTGIRLDHQDLSAQLVSGYNSWINQSQQNGADVNDTNGHGTHTAGIAGAIGNNGLGVSGVCQRISIMPIKVVSGSSGSSTMSALTGGAIWAVDHGARVVSTSFSGFDSSSSVQTTGDYIKHQKNGFYCWAAGNDSRNLTTGDWPDVTIVGASTSSDTRASFSAYGTAIDVFAPGVGILSTWASSSSAYTSLDGTSMATPCAAGVGGLLLMANPGLTGQQVEDAVYQTCNNIGSSGTFGWGRVNVNNALRYVYNTYPFNPTTATVQRGTLTSGGVGSLKATDGQLMSTVMAPTNTVNGADTIQIQYDTTTTIKTMGTMTLTYVGSVSAQNVTEKIELFNWTTSTFDVIDTRTAPTAITPITLNPSAPNNYKDANGLIRMKVTYSKVASAMLFQAQVDQVSTLTTP